MDAFVAASALRRLRVFCAPALGAAGMRDLKTVARTLNSGPSGLWREPRRSRCWSTSPRLERG